MGKKTRKQGRGFASQKASETIYIQRLVTLPEKEKNYRAFGFIEHLRNDKSSYKEQRTSYFLGKKRLRDIIFCNMDFRKKRITVDFSVKSLGLKGDLDWAAKVICSYSDEINKYIEIRDKFDRAYLLGNGELARDLANESKKTFGLNVWTVQAELLAARITGDSKKINSYISDNPVVNENSESLINNEVTKIDPNVSASRFKFSIGSNMEEMRNNGNIPASQMAEFFHMYSPDITIDNPENFLTNFQMMPIVDYYTYCIRLVRHLVINNQSDEVCDFIKKVITYINDEAVDFIANKIGIGYRKKISKGNELYLDACKKYEQGNYSDCLKILAEIINDDPKNIVLLELASKCEYRDGIEFNLSGISGEILVFLRRFTSGKYDQVDIDRFEKLSLIHSYSDWSFLMSGFLKRFGEGKDEKELKPFYDFSETMTTFINPFAYDFVKLSKSYIDMGIDSDWLNYWIDVRENSLSSISAFDKHITLGINNERAIKIIADCNYENKKNEIALRFYTDQKGDDKIIKDHCLLRSIRILCYVNRHEDALKIAAEKLVIRDSLFRIPLDFIIEKCSPILKTISADGVLNLAIVYHHENQRNGKVLQKLSICCYHYFRLKELNRLSCMDSLFEDKKSRYFSREILSEPVLDGFPRFFTSQHDVLLFRLSLLRGLVLKSSSDEQEIKDLIRELTSFSKIFLNELVRGEIGSGRIFLEKEKLLKLVSNKIREDYKALKEDLSDYDGLEDGHISDIDNDEDAAYILDDNLKKLTLLYLLIRDDYAVNKTYGLDNYLNLNIRHGGMVNHLWKPFKANNLVCELNSNGEYEANVAWEEYYPLIKKELTSLLNQSLAKFTKSMNEIINEAKGWVHVNTGEFADEKKIFNFLFDIDSLETSLRNIKESDNVEGFVLSTFRLLDTMLDESLEEAKSRVLSILRAKIQNCFDHLVEEITQIGFGNDSYIYRVVSNCRAQSNQSVEEFAKWFNYKESGNQPLPLDLVIETVHHNTSSYYPNVKHKIDVSDSKDKLLIKAKYITHFFDIFSLLINNAFQHSGEQETLSMNVSIESEDGRINVIFSNSISHKKIDFISKTIQEIMQKRLPNFEKYAYKDNGSGVCKVKKILTRDIGLDSDVSVKIENNQFLVAFSCDSTIVSENYE
ncbi:hypothetical protein Q8W30_17235 [Neptunomonas phycophila]|uniref:ATP-binding protein n=1 Tax=Neptunomonas phycophila TaxID=1572645 RepID=A0ABT9EZ73_9GAMM|nr:hypothetical protein [Neptunomonas phycophila]MDP2524311.1 hypothetical protein [Neptunomonas phycophila]